ncbi:DUF6505 family protein [Pseudohalocynthiibacter sp. F2068]|jgi:Family of unknown function (DUF6505)|uniref:DUF6505 family protein n=1 Tax=Pseudohalocynthiibacter sp. F2068 TaxID=2926418 RepID=UPI001FF1E2C2|nr:DUF6505 family protein [Pseudohalocynthiibacter sp. F2068]MCK0104284.1 DUF6505 family protein [Pseudohalocynthiibacter sp. F2068]
MKLARTIRLDDSDGNVFEHAAEMGEWAISGAFEFSNWTEEELKGKARQAFSNGWLSLESWGRATFVAVTPITEHELTVLTEMLAEKFVADYGAPDVEAARPVVEEELRHMRDMCEDQADNTLLVVSRSLTEVGVHEQFRYIEAQSAALESFAVHGSVD